MRKNGGKRKKNKCLSKDEKMGVGINGQFLTMCVHCAESKETEENPAWKKKATREKISVGEKNNRA